MVPEKGNKKFKALGCSPKESPARRAAGLMQPREEEVGEEKWEGWNLNLPVVSVTLY